MRKKYYERLSPTYNMNSEDFYNIKILHRVVGGVNSEEYAPVNKIVITDKIEKPTEMPEKMPKIFKQYKLFKNFQQFNQISLIILYRVDS